MMDDVDLYVIQNFRCICKYICIYVRLLISYMYRLMIAVIIQSLN